MKTGLITLLAAGVLAGPPVMAAEIYSATNHDDAAVAALSGGGRVTPSYNGFTVRTPRGDVRWTKTSDGYYALLNGQSIQLRKTYNGYQLSGTNPRQIRSSYDGLVVTDEQGSSERWYETHNGGYHSNGSTTPPSVDRQLALYSYYEQAHRPKVKRMKNARPSAFHRWPPAQSR